MKLKLLLILNHLLRNLTAYTHRLQFKYQWKKNPNPPEWFDHFLDQYYQMPKKQMSFWLERGVLNSLFLKEDDLVLELACGDGFNTKNFYSNKARHIYAVDIDPAAIEHAKKYNSAPNISYEVADIREKEKLPMPKFDHIIFDAAIEHFKEEEIKELLANLKTKLKEDGVFSGYTIIERGHVSHHLHEYEFKSKEDLEKVLKPFFKNVKIIYSKAAEGQDARENLYFFASDKEGWDCFNFSM